MKKRAILFRAEEKDLQAIELLKERWGLISDAAAIRFALRLAYRLNELPQEPVQQNQPMEVEK